MTVTDAEQIMLEHSRALIEARWQKAFAGLDGTLASTIRGIRNFLSRFPTRWICDACGRIIEKPADGQLAWLWHEQRHRTRHLRIVHSADSAPLLGLRIINSNGETTASEYSCAEFVKEAREEVLRVPLTHLTDDDGLMILLEHVQRGQLPLEELLLVIQRLHVPRYEEARQLVPQAIQRGLIKPNLSAGFFWQDELAEVISQFPAWAVGSGPTAEEDRRETLERYLSRQCPELMSVVGGLADAAQKIASVARDNTLFGFHRMGDKSPEHRDPVRMIDQMAHGIFIDQLRRIPTVRAVLSEEEKEPIELRKGEDARYLVAIDPLDGSDNSRFGLSLGSIFSLLPFGKNREDGTGGFLVPGVMQLAAGYFLYGSSTIMVLATGTEIAEFTLSQRSGRFVCTRTNFSMPQELNIVSVNEANASFWPEWATLLMARLRQKNAYDRTFVSRFSGTLVADIHRILCAGGVFFVPSDSRRPQGKLRLLYECSPLAMVLRNAGGTAHDGSNQILDIIPLSAHETCPFVAGIGPDEEL